MIMKNRRECKMSVLGTHHREAYNQRHGFPEPEDLDFERFPGIRTASILLDIIEDIMMMFLILDILFFSFMMF